MTPHGQAVGVCVRDERAPREPYLRKDLKARQGGRKHGAGRVPAEATMSRRLRIPGFTGLRAPPACARYSSGSVPKRNG
jgi:hypothetical protein